MRECLAPPHGEERAFYVPVSKTQRAIEVTAVPFKITGSVPTAVFNSWPVEEQVAGVVGKHSCSD